MHHDQISGLHCLDISSAAGRVVSEVMQAAMIWHGVDKRAAVTIAPRHRRGGQGW